MTTYTESELRLAREIVAAEISREPMSKIRLAEQVALSAIREATERAAELADTLMGVDRPSVFGGALRNWEHLKQ